MEVEFRRRCERDDVLLVGTNRSLCFRSMQDVRPDAMVIRDTYRSLWRDQKFGEIYHRDFWKPSECWKVGPAHRRVTHCDQYVRQAPGWQGRPAVDRNGELAVMRNSSVAIMAANWAWLRGARTIGLIGVDYRGRHAAMIEPFDSASAGWEGQYDKPVSRAIQRQFAGAAAAIEAGGGSLVNFSTNSRLNAIRFAGWRGVLGAGI